MDKVYIGADRNTYLRYDRGLGTVAVVVEDEAVETFDTTGLLSHYGRPATISVGGTSDTLAPGDSSANARGTNTDKFGDAVAYALNNGVKEIILGAGSCWFNPELGFGNTGADQKSLHLKGQGGGAVESQNTVLRFPDVTTVALNIGNGQCMEVSELAVVGEQSPTSRAALTGVGIGLNHNSHQNILRRVRVVGFNTCFQTGYDGDVLCDSNTFDECSAVGYIGWHFKQTQNYINTLRECVASCKIGVLSDVSKAVNIRGGNFSTSDGKKNAFTISSVTWAGTFLDTSTGDSITNREVTAIIASPDQAMDDGAYDVFCVYSDIYGPIPLVLRNWDTGTNTATFGFLAMWFIHRGSTAADTVLETEVEAATTLYACERITTFKGMSMNVDGVHVENPASLTTFHQHTSGFGGDRSCVFNRITFNHTISQADLAGGTEAQKAVWYCQQSFPFIESLTADRGQMEFSNISNTAGDDRVIVDIRDGSFDVNRLVLRNSDLRLNVRSLTGIPNWPATNQPTPSSMAEGVGSYDTWMFPWGGVSADIRRHYRAECYMSVPFKGHFPAPHARLRMHPVDLARVVASPLGTIGEYPPLMGGTMYDVDYTPYSGDATLQAASATRQIESTHNGFSWGQDITADWEYTGGTRVVRVPAEDQTYLFQGLVIQFDGVDAAEHYVITGLYPTLGFITVVRRRIGTASTELAGTVGQAYSGAAIDQQAFSFQRMSTLPRTKNVTNSGSGATTAAVGDLTGADLIYLLLTSIGAANFTTRTAAQMIADHPGAYVGQKWLAAIRNTNAGTATLNAGNGVTVSGTATIAQNVERLFELEITSMTAITITAMRAIAIS